MLPIDTTSIVSNILKTPRLRNIFLVCLTISIVFPLYSIFIVYPSFGDLLIKSTENDAAFAARHLTAMIMSGHSKLTKKSLTSNLIQQIKSFEEDFQLEKLNIFLKSGEIIYSSNPNDIGKINKEPYFHDVVSKGTVYTNVVQKNTMTLEGRVVKSDVVETYVPLIQNGTFTGVFEIYYNITRPKEQLENLLSRSTLILFGIASSLLIAVMVILFKASKTTLERTRAEEALQKAHGELEQRVTERTAELAKVNKDLRQQISERESAEKALRESGKRLHFLSSHLLTAQERERRRISLELHDELGQSLTVLKLQLRSIEKTLRNEQGLLKNDCEKTLQYVDQIIENVRRLSRDLSPSILEDLGLTAALKWLVEDFAKHSNIKVDIDMPDLDNRFSGDAQIAIYRIFQEAFTNIGKHAHAKTVSIVVRKEGRCVHFRVQDDGQGFDINQVEARSPTDRSLGLIAMDERARMLGGKLDINGQKGKGTRISFSIPIDTGDNSNEPL